MLSSSRTLSGLGPLHALPVAPPLHLFSPPISTKPHIRVLHTSITAVCAVLNTDCTQDRTRDQPLSGICFKVTYCIRAEQKFSVGEREALVYVWACELWHFTLRTGLGQKPLCLRGVRPITSTHSLCLVGRTLWQTCSPEPHPALRHTLPKTPQSRNWFLCCLRHSK